MKKLFKYILYIVLVIVVIVSAILLYQTYGVSESTDWEEKDKVEQQQENSIDSTTNSNSIFD